MSTAAEPAAEASLPAVRLGARHRPSGHNTRFEFPGGPFADYVADARARIAAARHAAGWQTAPAAIDMAAPYEASPEVPGILADGAWHPPPAHDRPRTADGRFALGVLLVHGLTDSPFIMRDLARHFVERRGALARAVLLPGHGSVPGDLLHTGWREWLRAVRYGIESFRGQVARLLVVGFSAGAALGLIAAREGAPIDGLLLFSPALRVHRLAPLAILHRLYSWAMPEGAWRHLLADGDPAKYESFAKQSVAEAGRLTGAARRAVQRPLPAPVFVAQSAWDATVRPREVRRFFAAQPEARNRMVWFDGDPAPSQDPRVERIALGPGGLDDPAGRILSISHGAVPVHPANPHYGRQGDYRDCLHYVLRGDGERARICCDDARFAAHPAPVWGEKNQPAGGRVLRRLTFNPYFERMTGAMDRFLDGLG